MLQDPLRSIEQASDMDCIRETEEDFSFDTIWKDPFLSKESVSHLMFR